VATAHDSPSASVEVTWKLTCRGSLPVKTIAPGLPKSSNCDVVSGQRVSSAPSKLTPSDAYWVSTGM
jgi:hypothetical protein